MQTAFVLNLEEGLTEKPYNVLGMPTYLKISAKETNGQFSLYYGEYKKNQGPPLHQHDLDEFFYVTEGEFLFQLGDKKVKSSCRKYDFYSPHDASYLSCFKRSRQNAVYA